MHEVCVQAVREDRAEDREPDRAADLPEEKRTRRRDAHHAEVDGVLHREHQHLHHCAEPETEHDHVERRGQSRRVDVELGEQHHGDGHEGRADDRKDPVAAEA